jgi:hypothetical protein
MEEGTYLNLHWGELTAPAVPITQILVLPAPLSWESNPPPPPPAVGLILLYFPLHATRIPMGTI